MSPPPDPLAANRAIEDQIATACGIVRRGEWGARAPATALAPDWNYDSIVIHYSGHETYSMRGIQDFDMDHHHWDDFAYHYAVGKDGKMYEGRELVFKGSHVVSQNTGKIGIVCLGDFDTSWRNIFAGQSYSGDAVPSVMLTAVKRLSLALIGRFPIKTFGGHIEYGVTDTCPGNNLLPPVVAMRGELKLAAPVYRTF